MKKLMIAAALALGFASMSQAAVYYWGAAADTALYDRVGQNVYVLASTFEWTDATTAEDVIGAAVSQGTFGDAGRSKGSIVDKKFSDTAEAPSTYDALFVLIDGDGKYVKWNETLTGNDAANPNPVSTALTASGIDGHISEQGGMKEFASVPEPTSGLLLLLGVAGLALRRRRA